VSSNHSSFVILVFSSGSSGFLILIFFWQGQRLGAMPPWTFSETTYSPSSWSSGNSMMRCFLYSPLSICALP
jgi:hypothetical protein